MLQKTISITPSKKTVCVTVYSLKLIRKVPHGCHDILLVIHQLGRQSKMWGCWGVGRRPLHVNVGCSRGRQPLNFHCCSLQRIIVALVARSTISVLDTSGFWWPELYTDYAILCGFVSAHFKKKRKFDWSEVLVWCKREQLQNGHFHEQMISLSVQGNVCNAFAARARLERVYLQIWQKQRLGIMPLALP